MLLRLRLALLLSFLLAAAGGAGPSAHGQPPARPAAPVVPAPLPPAPAATPSVSTASPAGTPATDATPPELLPGTPSNLPLTLTPEAGGLIVPPAAVPAKPTLPADTSRSLDTRFESSLAVPSPRAVSVGKPLSLVDAVRLTLLKSPQINLSQQDTVLARASLQIATGQFDSRLTGNLTYNRNRDEVAPSELRDRRTQREAILDAQRALTSQRLTLEATRDQANSLTGGGTGSGSAADLQAQLNSVIASITAQNATPQQQANITAIQRSIAAQQARENQLTIESLLGGEAMIRDQLRAKGILDVDLTNSFTDTLTVTKELRNGVILAPFTTYNASRPGQAIGVNRARVGFTVTVPLARGLGESDTAARERSAKIDYEASLLQFRHLTTQTMVNTALAYWQAVAAQERLALLLRSERIASTLVDLTDALVRGGEQTRGDLPLVVARQAETRAARYSGELSLLDARQQLALQIGLNSREVVAPLTAEDGFPAVVPSGELNSLRADLLAQDALALRADRQAASKLEVSGKVLMESARLEQRPRVDFSGRASATTINEGNALPGYFTAYGHNYTLGSFTGTLSIDWPFANNQLKGVYLQSLAGYNQRVTRSQDLARNIASSVVFALGSVRSTIAQRDQAGASAESYRQALDNEYQKYKGGISTLIDVIQIEQRLTSSQLSYVDAKQQYAGSLARLRFETGTLLTPTPGSLSFDRADFVTLPAIRPLPVGGPSK